MSHDTLTLQCPAKVNLALSVGPARIEDGLHPICSWMVTVDFGDTLKLTRPTCKDSSYEIRIADDAPSTQQIDWPIESDLAFRAHGLIQKHISEDLPINMELIKRVPTGAGLGGGSSDAAGMLVGLNRLFSLELNDEQLIQLGLQLGSDVAFTVWARLKKRSAIVSGIGGHIEPAPEGENMIDLALILPPARCGTSEVYRKFDRITHKPEVNEPRVRSLASVWPLASDGPFNDLTEAAFEVQPSLREMRDQVREATGLPVHLSGSGSAMFVVVTDADEGKRLTQAIRSQAGLSAIYAGSQSG